MHNPLAAAIATNRFGLGARPGELATCAADPRGWLEAQLDGEPPVIQDAGLQGSPTLLAAIEELRAQNREQRAAAGANGLAAAATKLGYVVDASFIAIAPLISRDARAASVTIQRLSVILLAAGS